MLFSANDSWLTDIEHYWRFCCYSLYLYVCEWILLRESVPYDNNNGFDERKWKTDTKIMIVVVNDVAKIL